MGSLSRYPNGFGLLFVCLWGVCVFYSLCPPYQSMIFLLFCSSFLLLLLFLLLGVCVFVFSAFKNEIRNHNKYHHTPYTTRHNPTTHTLLVITIPPLLNLYNKHFPHISLSHNSTEIGTLTFPLLRLCLFQTAK
jgi:hypothetical protein